METTVLAVFGLVYLGMLLGGLPGLSLDRTGVALLGAIAMVAIGAVTPKAAWNAIDVPTITLLFGMMILSAQLAASGFYARVAERVAALDVAPARLLFVVIAVAGLLSAVLVNDVVCLAMAPLLVKGCERRGLEPVPFLLALACASNVGSAATLIGNPQNVLIGQALELDFARYLADAIVPSALGLVVTWLVIVWSVRGRWSRPPLPPGGESVAYDRGATWKALLAAAFLLVAFLASPWPRETLALAAAGFLLLTSRWSSRATLARVDGQLLVLFMGLFVVQAAFDATGRADELVRWLGEHGVELGAPHVLFGASAVLSNVVSNVPAVMLLLPNAAGAGDGAVLALASTLAGNFILVGSIANLIVVGEARRMGVVIGWKEHARVGVPVTIATLAIAAAWLWLRAGA